MSAKDLIRNCLVASAAFTLATLIPGTSARAQSADPIAPVYDPGTGLPQNPGDGILPFFENPALVDPQTQEYDFPSVTDPLPQPEVAPPDILVPTGTSPGPF